MSKQGLVKTHFKMYKHNKLWLMMGVTTTALALEAVPATIAHADTATVSDQSTSTPTSAATSAGSAVLKGSTKTSVTSVETSGAGDPTNQSSVETSGAGDKTNQGSVETSGASDPTNQGSAGSTAGSSAASGSSVKAETVDSTTTSNETKSVTTTNTGSQETTSMGNTTNTTAKAASPAAGTSSAVASSAKLTKGADAPEPSDDTVVTIPDVNLSNAIKKAVYADINQPLTIGDIRHNQIAGNVVDIGVTVSTETPVTSLAGIEYLKYLPLGYKNVKVQILLRMALAPGIDLSPLVNLPIEGLNFTSSQVSQINLTPLMALDPEKIAWFDIDGDVSHPENGMTNTQLKELGSWLTAVGNNQTAINYMGFSSNSISDLSPLAGINKKGLTIYAGNGIVINDQPINVVANQTATFTGVPFIGPQGDLLSDTAVNYTYNTTDGNKKPLISLGNGQYQIDQIQVNKIDPWAIVYGYRASANGYYTIKYSNGVTFGGSLEVYQPAIFQAAPTVTVKYVDTKGQPIDGLADQVIDGKTIGDSFDLNSYVHVDGYTTIAHNGPVTGTFGQDPQTLYILLVPTVPAGNIKVNYVDEAGNILATDTATYPYGQLVDLSYQTAPKSFDGYTFKGLAAGSLAANGILTSVGGTVTYVYTRNVGNATVTYVDDTTGQVLTTDAINGTQGVTADYTTAQLIATYLKAGYDLVSDEVPTSGIVYSDVPATYMVHFKHQLSPVTDSELLQKPVTQTIHYVYTDGTTAAADKVTTITFTRTGTLDRVTGVVTYTDWVADQDQTSFAAQVSPVIASYTADQLTVAEVPVTAESADLETTVTYTADPVKPTDPDTGNNGGGTTTPTDPDTGNNGGGTTTPTDPDTGNNGGGTTTPTDPDTSTSSANDTINVSTPTAPTDVDQGQAAMIQDTPIVDKTKSTAKSTEISLAPAKAKINTAVSTVSPKVTPLAVKNAKMSQPVPDSKSKTMSTSKGLPQTNEQQNQTTGWLGLGVLLTTLLTAAGFRNRKS